VKGGGSLSATAVVYAGPRILAFLGAAGRVDFVIIAIVALLILNFVFKQNKIFLETETLLKLSTRTRTDVTLFFFCVREGICISESY
jgi:hypothetical protein